MNSRAGEELDAVNCRKLRDAFEGREAIYIEKGVLRVRVTNIRRYRREIHAEVEEVPTKGLEEFPVNWHGTQRTEPRRWNIGAGDLTEFSDRTWHMGYGGWSLFFAPEVVSGRRALPQVGLPNSTRRRDTSKPFAFFSTRVRMSRPSEFLPS